MQVKVMYKYTRPGGGVTISTAPPEGDYLTIYRLIADGEYGLQKDDGPIYKVIDVEDVSGWVEGVIPEPAEEEQPNPSLIILTQPDNPNAIAISEVEYYEWLNYKKKIQELERNVALVLDSVGLVNYQIDQLEGTL